MNLTISLATRGRPELLRETLLRTLENIRNPETTIFIAVDEDDLPTIDMLNSSGMVHRNVVVSVRPRPDALGAKFNRALVERPADVYLPMTDYCAHITPGFDEKIIEAAQVYSDGLCVAYGPMANLSFPCAQAVTHKLVSMIGYLHPPHYPAWWGDHDLHDIATMIDRVSYVDITVERNPKWPGTQNLRDVLFFAEFFDRMSEQREKIAQRIIESPKFNEASARKKALIRNFPLVRQRSRIINAFAVRNTAGQPGAPDSPLHQRLRSAANRTLTEAGEEAISWPPPPAPPDPRSVLFLTPNYSHWFSREFYWSSMQTYGVLLQQGVPQEWPSVSGHPFPDYVRDMMATQGLRKDYPYQNFFFIDDDEGFPHEKVLEFIQRSEPVVVGAYPLKTDPTQPLNYFINFVMDEKGKPVERDGLLRVASKAPAGFMRIKRWVLEEVAKSYGLYLSAFPDTDGQRKMFYDIFRSGISAGQWRGEDTAFISRCRDLGIEVWCDPNIKFTHRGTYMWEGSLADSIKHVTTPIMVKRPSISPTLDYGRAVYPDPPSHDFLTWLVAAEMMRRHHEIPAPLRVKFLTVDGQLGKFQWGPMSLRSGKAYHSGVSKEYYERMLEGVLRPAIKMMGAIEEPALDITLEDWRAECFPEELNGYVEYDHHASTLVDATRSGHKIPLFSPPQWAIDEVNTFLRGQQPIVITLREVDDSHQPERNSNLQEWLKFADWAQTKGYNVLFVRDTFKAHESLPLNLPTYPRASENAFVRLALYERALVNLLSSNGPIGWLQYSLAPYLAFKQLVPELPNWEQGSAAGWLSQEHLCVGEQWPWATSMQRLTWVDDTFDNIKRAFEEFIEYFQQKEAAE